MSNIKRMKNLVEISEIVTGSDNFYEIKDLVISKMLSVVHPTKACVNLFYNNDYNYSHLVCSATLEYIPKLFPKNEEYGSKIDFSLYPKYIHEAVFEKKIIIVKNIYEDERAKGEEGLAKNEGYVGRVVLPFIINNETVGFMTCYLKKEDTIDQEDIDFMSQVASLMSLSIHTTKKNKDIKNLVNKLRNSISNINKGSIRLYSAKDIYYYMKKMSCVIAETTNSEYSMINIYSKDDDGQLIGQKIGLAYPEESINSMNALMPEIRKSTKMSSIVKNCHLDIDGKETNHHMFIKGEIDSKSELLIFCTGNTEYGIDDQNTISILFKQIINSIRNYEYYLTEEKHKEMENDLSMLKKQQGLIMASSSDFDVFSDNRMYFYHRAAKLVGGDFFNAINLGDKIIFIVADVMGHGIVSNYIVAIIKGAFEILARHIEDPAEVLKEMNEYLYDEFDKMGIYSTAIVGIFDKNNLKLSLANAGHYFPIIISDDNKVISNQDGQRGLPLGIMEVSTYKSKEYDLSSVKEICFFTDGILEMKDKDGKEFGIEGLEEFLLENSHNNKEKTLTNIREKINLHIENKEKLDDILLVFIKNSN